MKTQQRTSRVLPCLTCSSIILSAAAAAKSLQLCLTLCDPETAAHQAPLSLGFSRQEHWSELPFPSPIMKVKSESEVAQSCPTLSDPMTAAFQGSSVHGIFQAGVLEWGSIAFSECHAENKANASWILSNPVLIYISFWFRSFCQFHSINVSGGYTLCQIFRN